MAAFETEYASIVVERIRLLLTVLAAATMAATPVPAQQKPERAIVLARAKALIESAHAGGAFEPGVWEFGPTARHKRSGMVCLFTMSDRDRIRLNAPLPHQDDDVSCHTLMGDVSISHFSSHEALVGEFEAAASLVIGAFDARFPDAQAYGGEVTELTAANFPRTRVRRLVFAQRDKLKFERIAVMDMGKWIITQRVTAPLASARTADRVATMNLMVIARDVKQKP